MILQQNPCQLVDVRNWINDGSPIPDWVQLQMSGEARMFIVANRARKPMNRLDDFHAALAAADEDAVEI